MVTTILKIRAIRQLSGAGIDKAETSKTKLHFVSNLKIEPGIHASNQSGYLSLSKVFLFLNDKSSLSLNGIASKSFSQKVRLF
jgi:hypothetical protein